MAKRFHIERQFVALEVTMPDDAPAKDNEQVELKKLELEEKRLTLEMEMRAQELSLARDRLEHDRQQAEHVKKQGISPLHATLIAAVAAVLGTALGNAVQGWNSLRVAEKQFEANLRVQERRAETDLILRAVAVQDSNKATKNLVFLVKAGLLQDRTGQIMKLVKAPKTAPLLPPNEREVQERLRQLYRALPQTLDSEEREIVNAYMEAVRRRR